MARSLRVERRLTVDELAERMALPRSTIYYWVRDLPLREDPGGAPPPLSGAALRPGELAPRSASAEPLAREAPAESSREQSEAAYREGLESFEELTAQPTFSDFLCIYVLAGERRERSRVALTNSDPAVMRLASRWLRRLTDRALSLSLQCSPGHSLGELQRFWGEIVGAEPEAIRPRRRRGGAGYDAGSAGSGGRRAGDETSEGRHGVLTVAVEDMLLRVRLQAWTQRTRESWR